MVDNGSNAVVPEKIFIPAKPKTDIYGSDRILNVCAYCRVSTDNDAQLSSFALQKEHYEQLMGTHPNWKLKQIYADEGISGTSLKKRDDFNRMIAACERGEYDLIVTKSVSRFARNLIDCVSIIRKLKQQNPPVGVFFETDSLNTLAKDSEMTLSFLATIAQEESVKKSESMNWSLKERFQSGKLLTPALLGYERPRNATGEYVKYAPLQIVESEAHIVRFIFDAFLAGKTTKEIAVLLTDIECPTKTGFTKWSESSISYILRNERYCGEVRTWKTFTVDVLEHKHRRNQQDRDQYLYINRHDPIISLETFEAAQILLANRKHHVRGRFPTMQVIDDGIFRGYIPVNHHWINDDPNSYYQASNNADWNKPVRKIRRSLFSAFNLAGYQVVRGQFMSTRPECPVIAMANGKITFNVQCMRKFADVPYIQLLLHPFERKIAIRPCEESAPYSIRWRLDPSKTIVQKTLICPHFSNALFQIMEWDPDYLYRIRGTWTAKGSEQIIVFNLINAVPATFLQTDPTTNSACVKRRTELFPEKWNGSFGEEFYKYGLMNSLYFVDPKAEWKTQEASRAIFTEAQALILSDDELERSMVNLRKRVDSRHDE